MKIKTLIITALLSAGSLFSTGALAQLGASPLQEIQPIADVKALANRDSTVVCGGSNPEGGTPSAYYEKVSDLSGSIQQITGKPVVQMTGGTLKCAQALASGEADIAILQSDVEVWLGQTSSPLVNHISYSGPVLTEAILAFCSREQVGNTDFGKTGQKKKSIIALAGSNTSGANITLNAIAGEDGGWAKPKYIYAGDWQRAMTQVKNGKALCAVGVSDPNAYQFESLDDQFGNDLMMVDVSDSDFWDIENLSGQQQYGKLRINRDSEILDDLLAKKAGGTSRHKVDVPALPAAIYYRTEAIPTAKQAQLDRAVSRMATLLEVKY